MLTLFLIDSPMSVLLTSFSRSPPLLKLRDECKIISLLQWGGGKPMLNEVKPPADATDFLKVIYRASSIKSGRKFDGANLITLFNKCLIGINTYRKNTQLIIKAKSRRSLQWR